MLCVFIKCTNLCFGATSTKKKLIKSLLNVTNIMTQLIPTKNIHWLQIRSFVCLMCTFVLHLCSLVDDDMVPSKSIFLVTVMFWAYQLWRHQGWVYFYSLHGCHSFIHHVHAVRWQLFESFISLFIQPWDEATRSERQRNFMSITISLHFSSKKQPRKFRITVDKIILSRTSLILFQRTSYGWLVMLMVWGCYSFF